MQDLVYTGQSTRVHGIIVTPEIVTYDGDSQIRVVEEATGHELVIPMSFLAGLNATAQRARSELVNNLDTARRAFYDLAADFGLENYRNGNRPRLSRPNRDLAVDQTPYMEWVNSPEKHGWSLRLAGCEDIDIAWAAWNDKPGLANIISLLDDPDTATIMASMVAPEKVAKMTARIAARRMREARELPAVTLDRARNILKTHHVPACTLGNPRSQGANLRLYTIKEGAGKAVPVAVAIAAPVKPNDLQPLTEAENALGWKEKSQLVNDRTNALRAPWVAQAKAAFVAAGWRVVEMPKSRTHSWGNPPEIFWVTPFDANQWATVESAAKAEHANFSMNGAGGY